MSGELVGIVLHPGDGPEDPLDLLILAKIAERQFNPRHEIPLSYDDLATLIRRKRSATANRVKRLRREGWVLCRPGGGRGLANLYRVNLARFSTAPGNRPAQTGLFDDEKPSGPERTVSERNRPVSRPKPSGPDRTPSVSVSTSVPAEAPENGLPMVYGSVRTDGRDVDEKPSGLDARSVLRDVPRNAWPRDWNGLRIALEDAAAIGHTAETVRSALALRRDDHSKIGGGVVLRAVQEIARTRPPSEIASNRCPHKIPQGDHFDDDGHSRGGCNACELDAKHLADNASTDAVRDAVGAYSRNFRMPR